MASSVNRPIVAPWQLEARRSDPEATLTASCHSPTKSKQICIESATLTRNHRSRHLQAAAASREPVLSAMAVGGVTRSRVSSEWPSEW